MLPIDNEKILSSWPASSILFKPIKFGALELPNRIVMAPLTRCRADHSTLVPNGHMAEHYRQRASAGLIIAEATAVTPTGIGLWNGPGIWSQQQLNGWKNVTKAVHAAGGRIFLQLWHVGRATDAGEFGKFYGGKEAVSSSTKSIQGRHVYLLRPKRPYPAPRVLKTAEITEIVDCFRRSAENAKLAGFDGIELHGANGYLVDQFLQDSVNQGRQDAYGGCIPNRARFLLEIVDALCDVWGPDRVGVHLAPRGDHNDMGDSNPRELFTYVARELAKRKIAFIFLREYCGPDSLLAEIKAHFGGPIIGNEAMTPEEAEALIEQGTMDAVGFGRFFIANPDLVRRIASKAPFNQLDTTNLYSWGPIGYNDYPELEKNVGDKTKGNGPNAGIVPKLPLLKADKRLLALAAGEEEAT